MVLITHKFREVMQFAEDVTILRAGKVVAATRSPRSAEALCRDDVRPERSREVRRDSAGAATEAAYLEVRGLHAISDRGTLAVAAYVIRDPARSSVSPACPATARRSWSKSWRASASDKGREPSPAIPFAAAAELEKYGVFLLTEEPLVNAAVRSMSVMENLAFRQFDRPPSPRTAGFTGASCGACAGAEGALRHPHRFAVSADGDALGRQRPAHRAGARALPRGAAADHAEPLLRPGRGRRRTKSAARSCTPATAALPCS